MGEDTGWKSHAFTSLLDSQETLIYALVDKLLDIPNNRSVRKEQEMDLKRKATVEGKITLRALKCCKVKSFRSFVYIFMHPFY